MRRSTRQAIVNSIYGGLAALIVPAVVLGALGTDYLDWAHAWLYERDLVDVFVVGVLVVFSGIPLALIMRFWLHFFVEQGTPG